MTDLKNKVKKLNKVLKNCSLCPHKCGINRYSRADGFCRSSVRPVVSTSMVHHGEEPPISGRLGSGTIFFSNCNMRCVYCQNYQISQESEGEEISIEMLADNMIELQEKGVHNINLVSPTIWVPQIIEAFLIAKKSGLDLPFVYNTGGYDHPGIIKMLEGLIDIYMPDIRYSDSSMARKYSGIEDYVKSNRDSILEMHHQVGGLELDKDGIAKKGILIRLLVLPENIGGIKDTLDFIKNRLSGNIYLSIMAQYHPVYKANGYPVLSRRVSTGEYMEIVEYAHKLGLDCGWTQDHSGLEPGKDEFIPDFNKENVFKYYKD
ncbi:radical SAM protein [Actinomycetota bacterium]